jgi:RHS repeat-associated protein
LLIVTDGDDKVRMSSLTVEAQAPVSPAAPQGLTATPAPGAVILTWEPVSGATSYNIYWAEGTPPGKGDPPIRNTAPPFKHAPLNDDGIYYYAVSAELAGVDGPLSKVVQGTPAPQHKNTPPVAEFVFKMIEGEAPLTLEFDANGSRDAEGPLLSYAWDFGDGKSSTEPNARHSYDTPGTYTVVLLVKDKDGATSTSSKQITLSQPPPAPEPKPSAPVVDASVATHISSATKFLYSGDTATQVMPNPDVIDPRRIAVIRGVVRYLDPNSHGSEHAPLSGVKISVRDHDEFGYTLSAADGSFNFVANGGGLITLTYAKDGYLPVSRRVRLPWQDYVHLPVAIMHSIDSSPVTSIDTERPGGNRVARGRLIEDQHGKRQATLIFPPGVKAQASGDGGSKQELGELSIRSIEYSVGPQGHVAMPRELPPNSGYTYAVELMAEEAESVSFDQPLVHYVDNFLNFPVGEIVPVGYLDRDLGEWVASDNGLVIGVVSVTGELAEVDIDGKGKVAKPAALARLGVTEAERRHLAEIYEPGDTLWRVSIPHFSPWDFNWPFGPPKGATPPGLPGPKGGKPDPDPCLKPGSVIDVQNQVLEEEVPVAGTNFSLHYVSDRVPGRLDAYTLEIPLSGNKTAAPLKRIELEIKVAGQFIKESFPPAPEQTYKFVWDGKDGFGRHLQGTQPATISVHYVYDAVYKKPAALQRSFAEYSDVDIDANPARQEITMYQEWTTQLGTWDARGLGLGGWSLSMHHIYDPVGRILFPGHGGRQSADVTDDVIVTVAGTREANEEPGYGDGGPAVKATLNCPAGVDVAPDGTVYIADIDDNTVRQVRLDGKITTIAGNRLSEKSPLGDGGPAIKARLNKPADLSIAPDGSIFIADSDNNRIRKLTPGAEWTITTVAGDGRAYFSGDGGMAVKASLQDPNGVSAGLDGSIYVADTDNGRVRRIAPDGKITTVAGGGDEAARFSDGKPARQVNLSTPTGVTVGADGSVYITDTSDNRVYKVTPDGVLRTFAGGGDRKKFDGHPATEAELNAPIDIDIAPDGTVYVAVTGDGCIVRITPDNLIWTVRAVSRLGTGETNGDTDSGETLSGSSLEIADLPLTKPYDVAIGKDGSIYIAEASDACIYRVQASLPGFSVDDYLIPSEDGTELYVFSNSGRHLQTLDTYTGQSIYAFQYDQQGYLTQIEGAGKQVTQIVRDAGTGAVEIISPSGERTKLLLGENGYLASITDPANATVHLKYSAGGLLTEFIQANGNIYKLTYDALGRLTKDEDPLGGYTALHQADLLGESVVALTTAMGQETIYSLKRLASGEEHRESTCCGGRKVSASTSKSGVRTVQYPDGTTYEQELQADPRFGAQVQLVKKLNYETPGGIKGSVSFERQVVGADPQHPFTFGSIIDKLKANDRTYTAKFEQDKRRVSYKTPMGVEQTMMFDGQWQLVEWRAADLAPRRYSWDKGGQLLKIDAGDGPETRTTEFHYNEDGYLTALTYPTGDRIELRYDTLKRLRVYQLPDGREISVSYDAAGNLLSITPPGRPAHTFDYSPIGDVTAYTLPQVEGTAAKVQYSYNLDGQTTQIALPAGEVLEFAYGGPNLIAVKLPEGQVLFEYDHDTGQLAALTSAQGNKISYEYDGPLLTHTTWSGTISGTVERQYDENFRVSKIRVGGEDLVSLTYDEDGLLTRANELRLERDKKNGALQSAHLDAVEEAFRYNAFGELIGQEATYRGDSLYRVEYKRDKAGRIIEKAETFGGETRTFLYAYDPAGQLVSARRGDGKTTRYEYDDNGNRVRFESPDGSIAAQYDARDRLVRWGSAKYTSSDNGHLLARTEKGKNLEYSYNSLGAFTSARLADGVEVEYLLDGLDRRIGKKVNGRLLQGFLYASILNPVAELDGSGQIVARFIYASRSHVPDYMVKDGVKYRILVDYLGSVRLVVESKTGKAVQHIDYDEFGNIILDTNPGFQPFGFAGGLFDQHTKLTHFGAREYDASTGRWLTVDPVLFDAGQTNLYAYVDNDPVNCIDPSGLGDSGRGAVRNNSSEPVVVLHNGVYTTLGPGQWTYVVDLGPLGDIDGVWVHGKFYPLFGAYGDQIVIEPGGDVTLAHNSDLPTTAPHPAIPYTPDWKPWNFIPWFGPQMDPSPYGRGAPDNNPRYPGPKGPTTTPPGSDRGPRPPGGDRGQGGSRGSRPPGRKGRSKSRPDGRHGKQGHCP